MLCMCVYVMYVCMGVYIGISISFIVTTTIFLISTCIWKVIIDCVGDIFEHVRVRVDGVWVYEVFVDECGCGKWMCRCM